MEQKGWMQDAEMLNDSRNMESRILFSFKENDVQRLDQYIAGV